MNAEEIYRPLGVSPQVCAFGERVLDGLRERFAAVDRIAEANQAKVLAAMQKNRVSAACFAATTGYGYDDVGRDKLERVYADCFHTEAALVRPQITCGTHALTVALSANLLPGDLIELQFLGNSYNYNLGSAMSLVLMVIVLLCMSFTTADTEEMEAMV
mgnify:CR=1 FL=1